MLFEAPATDPIDALRPVEIVRRADPPRSTGAFYNIWPTHADFRRDLLRYLLELEQSRHSQDAIVERFRAVPGDGERPVTELLRESANTGFERFRNEPALRFKQAMWAANAQDEGVRALLAAIYASISDTMVPLYARLLEASHRRMRPPHTLEELAVVSAALHEGLAIRWTVQPDAVPDGPPPAAARDADAERAWSLFASTAYTLFLAMSEPA
jgi:AcrR family transcriptional regulator